MGVLFFIYYIKEKTFQKNVKKDLTLGVIPCYNNLPLEKGFFKYADTSVCDIACLSASL